MYWGYRSVAALLGGLGIALGAFAAHGLKATLSPYEMGIWQTAVDYQFVMSLFVLAVTYTPQSPILERVMKLAIFGTLIFSGSLYFLAITCLKGLGMITPAGGLLMLAAWLLFAWHNFKQYRFNINK